MDPNATLKEALSISRQIVDEGGISSFELTQADRLAELVIALDEWIQKGGFLPCAWRKP